MKEDPKTVREIFANFSGRYKNNATGVECTCATIENTIWRDVKFHEIVENYINIYQSIPVPYQNQAVIEYDYHYEDLQDILVYVERPLNSMEKQFLAEKRKIQNKKTREADLEKAKKLLEKHGLTVKDPYDYGDKVDRNG